jgi:hypothetical protein
VSSTHFVHHQHCDISIEHARDARARAWVYVFQCWQDKQNAAGMTSTNSTSVKYTEGVGDIERQPD